MRTLKHTCMAHSYLSIILLITKIKVAANDEIDVCRCEFQIVFGYQMIKKSFDNNDVSSNLHDL